MHGVVSGGAKAVQESALAALRPGHGDARHGLSVAGGAATIPNPHPPTGNERYPDPCDVSVPIWRRLRDVVSSSDPTSSDRLHETGVIVRAPR